MHIGLAATRVLTRSDERTTVIIHTRDPERAQTARLCCRPRHTSGRRAPEPAGSGDAAGGTRHCSLHHTTDTFRRVACRPRPRVGRTAICIDAVQGNDMPVNTCKAESMSAETSE